MNIQLYVENQLCDFDKNTYFTLQKEFEDEAENIVKEIEYSYTISIPTSVKNKQIFGFIDSFDVANKFGRVYNAELYVDEILILKGKLKLSEIDGEYFKGNLYNPTNTTVSDILGDRNLQEIIPHMKPMNNMTDILQCNNYVMGDQSVDIPNIKYRDRHICYPYVLYSLPYNNAEKAAIDGLDFYTQRLDYGYHTMTNDNVFPAFNVCSVLKDMFKTEGYNLQGNIFDDEKFRDLYQTFSYSYNDYIEKKNVPYYLSFSCNYNNLNIKSFGTDDFSIPSTLQVATLWSEDGFESNGGGHFSAYASGSYLAGVDCPLVSDNDSSVINIISNEQHMMTKGEEYDGYAIVVPRSGWYKIHCDGWMNYPLERSSINRILFYYREDNIYKKDNTEAVGGVKDECDNTSLEQQPFEFQIKKGNPAENPQLYSFNSCIPCMPTHYAQFKTVQSDEDEYAWSAIKCGTSDSQSFYGKNGKQTYIKDYSDKPTSDFIAGVRLGGALFSKVYNAEYYEDLQSENRFAYMGECLALPRADKPLTFKTIGDDKYFMLSKGYYCDDYEYAERTAQVLLRPDAYSNFDGYNKVNFENGTWDTTSNYKARTYSSDDSQTKYTQNYANATDSQRGNWNINTVVWLEKGDNISFELIMPYHYGGRYYCCHSKWVDRMNWVNNTMVDFRYEMAYINSDKKWQPTASSPIPTFNYLSQHKETNVNQFLPNVKCNDYLNKFLQTFNLQLTMPNKNTFSIDYAAMNDVMGNIISIEGLTNIKDAEFKALDTPSQRQLSWKIDTSETGYYHGNQSPYKVDDYPWYESGYTGGVTITNETNTSGSIDKKESSWSYNWYKDIKFLNGLGLSITGAPRSESVV